MIHLFIPYVERFAIWQELRYALRSWETHATFDFKVVLVGDKPNWIKNVIHIPHTPKYDGNPGEITRDAIAKLRIFCEWMVKHKYESFIRTYDDIILLHDVTRNDIAIPKAIYDMTRQIPNKSNTWRKQLWDTYDAVRQLGCHGYNYETHLPEAFVAGLMLQFMNEYNLSNNTLLTSSLYFNTLTRGAKFKPVIIEKADRWKAGFYGTNDIYSYGPTKNVSQICADKMFCNFNDAGLSNSLKTYIENKFQIPSRYEI